MRRPTKRSLVLVGVGALLAIAGSTAQAGWLFVLAAGVTGTLGASLLVPHGTRGLRIERDLPPAVTAGDEVRVALKVRNEGRRSTGLVRVNDTVPGLADASFLLERCAPGERASVTVSRAAERRGVFSGGKATIETGPPFGFVVSNRKLAVGSSLVVKPATVTLESFPLSTSSSAPSSDLRDRPRAGMGDEFLGVRHYRAGDPLRSVHWRSTARAGQLVVKEYEETAQERCIVVLGGSDSGDAPDSAFEKAVSAAGSIALYAIEHRHPLEMLRFDDAGRVERLSQPSAEDVLLWLAAATPSERTVDKLVDLGPLHTADTSVVVVSSPEALPSSFPDSPLVAVVGRPSTWTGRAGGDEPAEIAARLPRVAELRLLERVRSVAACLAG
ncbi:MAG: DUF58 domain-containing protein [Actinomycetota bacterium]